MPYFSERSLEILETLHPDLQKIAHRTIKRIDFSVTEGHRTKEEHQKKLDHKPKPLTQVSWEESKHSLTPSKAGHFDPYPIDYSDRDSYHFLAGIILATGWEMGILIRWGGDWNMNWSVRDNNFDDLAHYEIIGD